ncbi:hypothetical protein LWE61_18780 [Sphingobium sufflavum]|uniref:hypothetical protein n=1 Tax=Sphingobium sufflavum TaxID=1129547 RepID=UPI001F4213AD|nr:hypothetical protein [Sphingobium sufflavum]MCE7798580.1 hypothetical protein [Sphingobium sufflavum]
MNMMSVTGSSATRMSPRAMMDNRIDTAVKSGSISATDETALENALDAIDSALGVGSSSGSGSAATGKLDPAGMKDRIDSLISDQVTAGTLTDEQAATLQSLFAQGGPQPQGEGGSGDTDSMAMGGVGGRGGMRPMGPPPPPPSGTEEDSSTSGTSATEDTDQLDALISLLSALREQMASKNVYSSTSASTTAADSRNSGLIVDTLA